MRVIPNALLMQISGGCDEVGIPDDGFCHPPALPEVWPTVPIVPAPKVPRLFESYGDPQPFP